MALHGKGRYIVATEENVMGHEYVERYTQEHRRAERYRDTLVIVGNAIQKGEYQQANRAISDALVYREWEEE